MLGGGGGLILDSGAKIVERQEKVRIKKFANLAIFFLCPNKQFLSIPFQIQLLEYFPQKQKEQKTKAVRCSLVGYHAI